MPGELHQILLDLLFFSIIPEPVFVVQFTSDFFLDVSFFQSVYLLNDLGVLSLQGFVIGLFSLGLFVEFGDCLLVYDLDHTLVPIHLKCVKDVLKMRIQAICAFVVVTGLCAALVIIEVPFLDDVAPHRLAAMSAGHKALERDLGVFLDNPVALCVFLGVGR